MTNESAIPNIKSTYVVLDNKGKAASIAVTETFWQDLENKFGDFSGDVLVVCFSFEKDWDTWEIHPYRDEFACLLSGDVDFVLEEDGAHRRVCLNQPGSLSSFRVVRGIPPKLGYQAPCCLSHPVRVQRLEP